MDEELNNSEIVENKPEQEVNNSENDETNGNDETILELYPDEEGKTKQEKLKEEEEKKEEENTQNENIDQEDTPEEAPQDDQEEKKEVKDTEEKPKKKKGKKKKKKKKKKEKKIKKIQITAKDKEKNQIRSRGSPPPFRPKTMLQLKPKDTKKERQASPKKNLSVSLEDSKKDKPIKIKIRYNLKPIETSSLKRIKEKETFDERYVRIRKLFADKKISVEAKNFQYVIMPGNASYLIKNCFDHRKNWKESQMQVTSIYNFKWQQSNICIDFSQLSKIKSIPQLVNHFEFHSVISNKFNMFLNLFDYCEKNDINVFKYVPFTVLLSSQNNSLQKFEDLYNNISDFVYDYDKIGNFPEMKKGLKKDEKTKLKAKEYAKYFSLSKISDSGIEINQIGEKTPIAIPKTHYDNKNFWVVKASNLNRGQCIRVADSVEKIKEIIDTFSKGIDIKAVANGNNENNIQLQPKENKVGGIVHSNIYKASKIIIQKYIERPLLFKGRKCDMRVWVLLTHDMKVYVCREGHLKTCSAPYDIEKKDAYVHITNYSFQKHSENFQKFEIGNEIAFFEFQKFLNKKYPDKKIDVYKDVMGKVNEIVMLTMNSVKDTINKNKRTYSFEIFGYDFMLDEDFNMFLIEVNTNPGIEESSPWIKVIIPRMLDDALRLTVDKIFPTKYEFNQTIKEVKVEECGNEIYGDEEGTGTQSTEHNNSNNSNAGEEKESSVMNSKPNNHEYISPFPVPGYKNSQNIWELVGNIAPLEKKSSAGIKTLLSLKKQGSTIQHKS